MTQIRNIAKLGLLTLLTSYNSASHAATIVVNTTDMTIDANEGIRAFIALDTSGFDLITGLADGTPIGRSGVYKADTLTISDLNDLSKNPADAESGAEPAISLPEAIIAANNTAGPDTITLAAGKTYNLNSVHSYWYGPNALPPITSAITITGTGLPDGVSPQQTDKGAIIQRNPDPSTPKMRLFFVMGAAYSKVITSKAQVGSGNLSLQNLTIKNGYAQGGNGSGGGAGMGGAIFNQGFFSTLNSTFSNNTAHGGDGGNSVGFGGGGVSGDGILDIGGGFFNTHFIGSEAFIYPSDITKNSFTSIFGGNGGPNGSGGFGPLNDNGVNGGHQKASNSTHDIYGAFGAGGGRAAKTSPEDGNGGAFGSGGGYGVAGGPGGFGGGGGQSTSATDSSAGFAGGNGSLAMGGGGGGLGGAIFNHTGLLTIQSSTFSENTALGGSGHFGGSAYGAAIFSSNAPTVFGLNGLGIYHSTIFNNNCTLGLGTIPSNNGVCNSPVYTIGITGAGVQDGIINATATIANSIIANTEAVTYANLSNNQVGNSSGSSLTLSGINIIRRNIPITGGATIDQSIANTKDVAPFPNHPTTAGAGQLQDNGGPTATILPLQAPTPSPAIDAADNLVTQQAGLAFDQRRIARVKNTVGVLPDTLTADIGSVETGLNLDPVITLVSTAMRKTEDSRSILLSSLISSITDGDNLDQPSGYNVKLSLTMQDVNGTLNIPTDTVTSIRDAGLAFITSIRNGVDETNMSITAPLPIIFIVLRQIKFTPADGLGSSNGDSSDLLIEVDDLGSSGSGPGSGPGYIPATSLTTDKTLTISIIGTAPVVALGSIVTISNIPVLVPAIPTQATNGPAFSFDMLFSEPVQGFDSSDIKITNGTLTSELTVITADQAFRASIRPNGQGDVTIEIPAGIAEDPIGLKNTASNIITVKYDATRPNIKTSGLPSRVGRTAFIATINFDEEVDEFTVGDIDISEATLSDFKEVNKSTYSVTITPSQKNGISLSIKDNVAADSAGNGNHGLTKISIPLQRESSSSSYNPLFLLALFMLIVIRRKPHYCA